RLTTMREAIRRAGRRLQEEKRQLEIDREQQRALSGGAYETEMRSLAGQMTEKAHALKEQEQALLQRQKQAEAERQRREADLVAREKKLDEDRQALSRSQTQHQTDLVRLDRLAATLEQRQRQVQKTALEVDRRYEALQRDTRELEEQAARFDELQADLIIRN